MEQQEIADIAKKEARKFFPTVKPVGRVTLGIFTAVYIVATFLALLLGNLSDWRESQELELLGISRKGDNSYILDLGEGGKIPLTYKETEALLRTDSWGKLTLSQQELMTEQIGERLEEGYGEVFPTKFFNVLLENPIGELLIIGVTFSSIGILILYYIMLLTLMAKAWKTLIPLKAFDTGLGKSLVSPVASVLGMIIFSVICVFICFGRLERLGKALAQKRGWIYNGPGKNFSILFGIILVWNVISFRLTFRGGGFEFASFLWWLDLVLGVVGCVLYIKMAHKLADMVRAFSQPWTDEEIMEALRRGGRLGASSFGVENKVVAETES